MSQFKITKLVEINTNDGLILLEPGDTIFVESVTTGSIAIAPGPIITTPNKKKRKKKKCSNAQRVAKK